MANAANRIIRFKGGKVLRESTIRDEDLWIQGGTIIPPASRCDEEIDAAGMLIAPGYIDLQVNGAYGRDFSSDSDALATVSPALARHGVTSFLPTLISSTSAEYRHTLIPLQKQLREGLVPIGALPLGIHLEGPFLHPDFSGAHPRESLQHFNTPEEFETFYGSLEHVKIVHLSA